MDIVCNREGSVGAEVGGEVHYFAHYNEFLNIVKRRFHIKYLPGIRVEFDPSKHFKVNYIFKDVLIMLKIRVTKKGRQKERSGIHWFIPRLLQ